MKKWVYLVVLLGACVFGYAQGNGGDGVRGLAAFQSSIVRPVAVVGRGAGHYFFDFGKDAFGSLSVLLKAAQADSLVVHVGEKLRGSFEIDRAPGGSLRYQRLVLRGLPVGRDYPVVFAANARNERPPAIALPDSFGRVMPFRYVEVENLRVPAGDFFVKKKVFNWRFDDSASYFVSSDTVLNRVWEMCKHTVKATSFCGLYVDGDRERTPYEADALINQLSHYAVDREYSLARRTNAYFIDHPTWPTEWILQTPSLFYNDYLYTGDTGALSKYYSALKEKTLVALEREDGLISVGSPAMGDGLMKSIGFSGGAQRIRDIVDWPVSERDGYEMMAYNTVVNAFHYQSLVVMGEIAGALGRKEDSVEFFRRALLVKDAVNHRMLDKSRGIYVDGEGSVHSSLHANLFPLAFGMVPKENMSAVVAFVKSRGMACSVYGAQYLLEALYRSGEADYALSLMDDTAGDRNWWNMIESGSTMALEAWDIKYKPNLDWNHAWGTAPANVVVRDMWGIRPMKPGFASVVVKPQLGRLAWSRIKVPTMRGAIRAEYDKGEYMIELSKGMAGRFELRGVGVVLHEGRNRVSSRLPVIFDTDMGPDYDDVGAIAMLHAFADSGMAEILGTIASNKYEGVAGVLNVFNTYFGRPEIPIGVPRGKAVDQRDGQHWTDSVLAKYPHVIRRNDEVADAVDLYRRLLAGSKDSSVVIITVGFLTNLSNLLKSGPDEYSSLGGIELVKRKVRQLVSMAGSFPAGREFNAWRDAEASGYAFAHWPTEVVFSGWEIGSRIRTGLPLVRNEGIRRSPVKDAFRICIPMAAGDSAGRMSWDETAVLVGVAGAAPYFGLVPGRIVVGPDGSNVWDTNGKGQFYLVGERMEEVRGGD